jgi:hypothetical protein
MHFRWTSKTARIAFVTVVAIPAAMYLIGAKYDVCLLSV